MIELVVGDVRIAAGDRADTVVELRPSDSARPADVNAAEQTRVEYSGGRLLVKATGRWRSWSPFGYGGSVDVSIELPTGSRVTGASSLGSFRCTGVLGDCHIKTAGEIHVEQARTVKLMTGLGDINVERASGDAELITASGDVHAEEIDGAVVIKNSNGDTRVGEITGELSVKAANGEIAVARSHSSIVAKTANGDIRVGAAGRGSVVAETGVGGVEIAIPEGTAAWLDLHTGYGQLHNNLEAAEAPQSGADAVEVRARTGYGDITIRRYVPAAGIDSTA
ncbi:MAG: DUF4097 family beta strand repeat-containing protein [Solirubrobacteraceae bacterium]